MNASEIRKIRGRTLAVGCVGKMRHLNIFLVSEKMVIKLIREMWNSIVSAIKLIAFNPENLNAKE